MGVPDIAWIDDDGDGVFDLDTSTPGPEKGYFPIKNIEGTDRIIQSFGYIDFMGIVYLISYWDGSSTQNDGLDIRGTSGFNFVVD